MCPLTFEKGLEESKMSILEVLFERAIAAGFTDEWAVSRMHENLASGKFTPEHYLGMWEHRFGLPHADLDVLFQQAIAQGLATKSAVSHMRMNIASGTFTQEYYRTMLQERFENQKTGVSNSIPTLVLFQQAIAQGLTTESAVTHMRMNLAAGKFTEEYYQSMWQERLKNHKALMSTEKCADRSDDTLPKDKNQQYAPRVMTAASAPLDASTACAKQSHVDRPLGWLANWSRFCSSETRCH